MLAVQSTGCRVQSQTIAVWCKAYLSFGTWDLHSLTRDRTRILCIARWILNHWTTSEVPRPIFIEEQGVVAELSFSSRNAVLCM